MDRGAFARLVRDLIEAMGQRLGAARPIPEGLALRTADQYLYVFVDDVSRGSTDAVHRWCVEEEVPADHLVVFSAGSLPGSWQAMVEGGGGKIIAGPEFRRLLDELGIDSPLIERDPTIHRPVGTALPSARELDANMVRAETWATAGVLPLAARFYERAVELKPEYVAGWVGLARTQTALEAWPEATVAWNRVLALDSGSVDARLGLAAAAAAAGDTTREVALYRALLLEQPGLTAARVGLVAALIHQEDWSEARRETETLLTPVPNDPRLRLLHALTIERSGGPEEAARAERDAARRQGLTEEMEQGLLTSLSSRSAVPSHGRGGKQAF